jgi:hypothetical protein
MVLSVCGEKSLCFSDESVLELNDTWIRALSDKLKEKHETFKDFLVEFDAVVKERWETRTFTARLAGVVPWSARDDHDFGGEAGDFRDMSELAENELYHYLRAWIMGLISSKHGGKALILTEDGIIEYP